MARPHDVSTKRIGRPIYTYAAMYVNECTYITFTCRHTIRPPTRTHDVYIYVVPPIWPDIHIHTRTVYSIYILVRALQDAVAGDRSCVRSRLPGRLVHHMAGRGHGRGVIRVAVSVSIYTYTCPAGNPRAYICTYTFTAMWRIRGA